MKLSGASQETKTAIYNKYKWALEQSDWQSYWVGNADLSSSKFKDDSVQIYDLIIVSNKSTNNIVFTYFPKANQIFYTSKQFIEGPSSLALDAFKDMKAKETTKIIKETDNYGFTQKEGFLEFAIYHIKSPNAVVSYMDYGLIDTK
ncbi:hypothetical protein LMJ53_09220 [Rheinheimera sp. UJ51]|uniref:hypothetical protein n=1 Tax=Rheinheimera sp. UJ51 TaxID=2892446 RepID=UPI001E296A2B|nr:hypothetical protein [Rheinheimera sp. UJ51]MCC5451901.1 hypothetical protein [Rheinheimera sp. UJ51]